MVSYALFSCILKMRRSFNNRKLKILAAVIQNPGLREFQLAAILGLNPGHSGLKNALLDLRNWGYVWVLWKKTLRYWYPTIEGAALLKSYQEEKDVATRLMCDRFSTYPMKDAAL